jgi:2,3-bisphosphoglycerate-independent phosphoglycerate mutase
VTYFLNGGREEEWPGETRILVPSPRDVPTYDKKPEMSAAEVASRVAAELPNGYRFAIVNFANPDMVGHTGVIPAVVAAVEATDAALGRLVEAVNAEKLLEADGVSPHTAHTTNPVPLVITLEEAGVEDDGALADLVPTCLWLLGIPLAEGMTGRNLIRPF